MSSKHSLLARLKHTGVLKSPDSIAAFEAIDRKDFVPETMRHTAYADDALPIGLGQTISQPWTVFFMLKLLAPEKGERVLDVGSGSGFTTALLAHIVGPQGRVIGTEIVPELVAFGKENLHKYSFPNAEIREAGPTLGAPENAPFDKILVSASARSVPQPLIDQLKAGGRMVFPIGEEVWKVDKILGGTIETERYGRFLFVPLIEKTADERHSP